MKKLLLPLAIVLMAFCSANVSAQRAFNDIDKQVLKQHFNTRGTIIRPVSAIAKRVAVTTIEEDTFTYDEYEYYLLERVIQVPGMITRDEYEYDFDGNVVVYQRSHFLDASPGVMMGGLKSEYTYEDGQVMEVVKQRYLDGQWNNDEKETYNYNGDEVQVLVRKWQNNTWATENMYTYTYFDDHIEVLKQYMRDGAWQNESMTTYKLNGSGTISQILVMEWEDENWVNDEFAEYTYTGEVYTRILWKEWDNNAWADEARISFTYVDGNATHAQVEAWTGSQWTPSDADVDVPYGYNTGSVEFPEVSEVSITYDDLTSVDEAQGADVIVRPTIANNSVTVTGEQLGTVCVYNALGQLVERYETQANALDINTSSYGDGMYIVTVNGKHASRFVVTH